MINDPNSGYIQWPSQPPPGPPTTVNNGPLPLKVDPAFSPPVTLAEAGPSSSSPRSARPQTAAASPHDYGPPETSVPDALYSSPYAQLPSTSKPTPSATTAPGQAIPPQDSSMVNNVAQPHTQSGHGPSLQPAAPRQVVLSRNRETKILLSIDGDGIRGLSALLLIESLVNAICVKIGQRLDPHQIFDLTGGSSLGGVIAILLCRLQMQAHRAREAYKRIAKQVFLNKRDFFASLDPQAPAPHSDGKDLEDEIKAVIHEELGTQDERLLDPRDDSGDV